MKEDGTFMGRHPKGRAKSVQRSCRAPGAGDSGGSQGPALWRRGCNGGEGFIWNQKFVLLLTSTLRGLWYWYKEVNQYMIYSLREYFNMNYTSVFIIIFQLWKMELELELTRWYEVSRGWVANTLLSVTPCIHSPVLMMDAHEWQQQEDPLETPTQ